MRPITAFAVACSVALGATSCAQDSAGPVTIPTTRPPVDNVTAGSGTAVDPGMGVPPWHPSTPLGDPILNDGHVGRAPRRVNVVQLRAALITAVGVTWVQPRRILSADYSSGYYDDPSADMLELLASTLGQPDYQNFTSETLDPSATFSKLVGDAARKACRDGVVQDLGRQSSQRLLMRFAGEGDTAAANEAAVRRNLAYLILRFWARSVPPTDPAIDGLLHVFAVALTASAQGDAADGGFAAGTPVDGWRAVCIALATDNQFLTY